MLGSHLPRTVYTNDFISILSIVRLASYFNCCFLEQDADMLKHVLEEIELAKLVGLAVLVRDAAAEHAVALLLDTFLVQIEAADEEGDLEPERTELRR